MSPSFFDPNEDFLSNSNVPWWKSIRFRWLIAAPLLALPLIWMLQGPLRRMSSTVQATWRLEQALEAAREYDQNAALEKVDLAIESWPMHEQLYMVRAEIRREIGDLRGSMEDYDIAVHLAPTYADAYMGRAVVRRLLGHGSDALEDIDVVVSLRPRDDPEPLNMRAYFRALEGVKLSEALDDVQRAISLVDRVQPGWLDTRACVFLGMGKLQYALNDANDAIRLTEEARLRLLQSEAFRSQDERTQRIRETQINEQLSVIYHHRSQIHAAIGETVFSSQDAQQAQTLGFRPEIE